MEPSSKDTPSFANKGQSLVQMLVAVAIMSIIMLAFTSMLTVLQRETKHLSQKITVLELKNLLSSILSDGSVCAFELNNPTVLSFDSTNPSASISINQIHASASSSAPIVAKAAVAAFESESSVLIQSISLKGFTGTGTTYIANWEIAFDQSTLVHPLKPILIPTKLIVDNTTPTSTKIQSCYTASTTTMKWFTGTGCAACPYGSRTWTINLPPTTTTTSSCLGKDQNGDTITQPYPNSVTGGPQSCHTTAFGIHDITFGFWSY